MKLAVVRLVAAKELRETLRDRRTLAVMLLFPLVVYPIVMPLLAMGTTAQLARTEARRSRVAVVGAEASAAPVRARLATHPKTFEVVSASDAPSAVTGAVAAGTLDAVAEAAPAPDGRTRIDVVYDGARDESKQAQTRLANALVSEMKAGCGPLFDVGEKNVAPQASEAAFLLSKLLPLIIVVIVGLGAFHPAIDITAGERERGTLETILSSPVDRHDLMAGKIVAVAALSAITGLLNLASMALTTLEGARLAADAVHPSALAIPWGRAAATLLLVVVPASFLFASIMVAIGSIARSYKEAQTLLTPVYFVCLTPAIMASVSDWTLTGGVALVPGVNIMLLSRHLILGTAKVGLSLVVVGSTLAYGALALSLAARLYDSERLLAADDGALGLVAWLRRLFTFGGDDLGRSSATPGPGPGHALVLFVVAYALFFYVFAPLQIRHLDSGLLLSEWGGLLGLVAVYARVTRQRLFDVLRVRRAPARALVGAMLVGASAWIVVGQLAEWLVPAPKELVERLRHMIAPDDGHRGLVGSLALMALTPAVCEEALFRGPILRGLAAKLPRASAAVLTGLFFGLFHFDAWRLLPTGVLGVILSFVALETGSILPSMLAHFVNNACLLVLTFTDKGNDPTELGRPQQAAVFGAALVVLGAGLSLLRNKSPQKPSL